MEKRVEIRRGSERGYLGIIPHILIWEVVTWVYTLCDNPSNCVLKIDSLITLRNIFKLEFYLQQMMRYIEEMESSQFL